LSYFNDPSIWKLIQKVQINKKYQWQPPFDIDEP
jgi:hypothetical protein